MTRKARKCQLAAHRMHYVRRIVRAWNESSAADLEAGLQWYRRAESWALHIHPNRLIGAGVLAALSPRCEWNINKRWARELCDAALARRAMPAGIHTFAMRRKAWRITQLENPTIEAIVHILHGPKITRFFLNIIGNLDVVTIDVWAQRVATGKDSNRPPVGLQYQNLERAYQAASKILNAPARDIQAATWVHLRGSADVAGNSTAQLGFGFYTEELDATFDVSGF